MTAAQYLVRGFVWALLICATVGTSACKKSANTSSSSASTSSGADPAVDYSDEQIDPVPVHSAGSAQTPGAGAVRSYGIWEGGAGFIVAHGGQATGYGLMTGKWDNVKTWQLELSANRFPNAWARRVISTDENSFTANPHYMKGLAWGNRPSAFAFARTREGNDWCTPIMEVRRRGVWKGEFLGGNRPGGTATMLDACLIDGVLFVALASGHNGRPSEPHNGLTVRSLRADGWHTELEVPDDAGVNVAIGAVTGRPAVITAGGDDLNWFECAADGHWLPPVNLPFRFGGNESLSINEIEGNAAVLVAAPNAQVNDVVYHERRATGWTTEIVSKGRAAPVRLLNWNGNPAFALGGSTFYNDSSVEWISRKNGIWSHDTLAKTQRDAGYFCDGAIIGNRPSVVFSSAVDQRIHYCALEGTTWGDTVIDDSIESKPLYFSLFELKGRAALFAGEWGQGLPLHLVYFESPQGSASTK